MENELDMAINAAREAGRFILEKSKTIQLSRKSRVEYTTNVDKEAEMLIAKILSPLGYSFYGEETGRKAGDRRYEWIVDPIDGTINYIKGIPLFTVSIALLDRNTNEVQVGVVYNPSTDECYSAAKSMGAFLNHTRQELAAATVKPALVLAEHGYAAAVQKIYLQATGSVADSQEGICVVRYGSTALMICLVASGHANAFFSVGDQLYDHAAGLLIAKEAGAMVTDWKGAEWTPMSDYLLIAPKAEHKKIAPLLSSLQKSIPRSSR